MNPDPGAVTGSSDFLVDLTALRRPNAQEMNGDANSQSAGHHHRAIGTSAEPRLLAHQKEITEETNREMITGELTLTPAQKWAQVVKSEEPVFLDSLRRGYSKISV
jgi:hypothetical protein